MPLLNLTTTYPLWLASLCVLLGLGYAAVLYWKGAERYGWGRTLNALLFTLRTMAIAFLAFFLLSPVVRTWVREVRKPIVVVAHDGSASLMAAGDTASVRTTYAQRLEDLVQGLSEKFDVRTFTYGNGVEEGLRFTQEGNRTDLAQLLREVHDRLAGPDLGAVIVDGDGIYNRGRDPRHDAAKLGVPIHAIALGDTTVRPDLLVRSVDANRIAYLGNEFPLLAHVEAHHLDGRRSRVQVFQQERSIAEKELTVQGDPFIGEVPLLITADRPGLQRYTVSVRPIEGEVSTRNNTAEVVVHVLDDRQKVLLLGASPHPDLGALREALATAGNYKVDLAFASTFQGKPEEHDLVVAHRLPGGRVDVMPFLRACVAKGIPVITVIGEGTDMNAFNGLRGAVHISSAQRGVTDARPAFHNGFGAFRIDQATINAFERFPPLQVPFGQYEAAPGASPLFDQMIGLVRTTYPLVVLRPQGEVRSATICGEGIWRWRLADQQQNNTTAHFDGLFRKLVQLLANRADDTRFRIDHPDGADEQEPIVLQAEVYDLNYELVDTGEVELVLTDEEGSAKPYAFSRTDRGFRLAINGLRAGRYSYDATAALANETLKTSGEFVVRAVSAERTNTIADRRLWADLAAASGGSVVGPDDLAKVREQLDARAEMKPRSYAYASFTDLITLKWPFFVLLGLLVLEWVLRRRSGAY
ncbi:MAG: hypothetical protein H6595_12895 [Flavobacteriales bacterium]|nr:hypothetical protein [Flavobacteriales bacterium]MCB9168361.1 hypothetical protein [Flavobacteriales bacterium]